MACNQSTNLRESPRQSESSALASSVSGRIEIAQVSMKIEMTKTFQGFDDFLCDHFPLRCRRGILVQQKGDDLSANPSRYVVEVVYGAGGLAFGKRPLVLPLQLRFRSVVLCRRPASSRSRLCAARVLSRAIPGSRRKSQHH